MTTSPQDTPDPELHEVDDGGYTYETPLTLGPDSDHAGDPIRTNQHDHPTQPSGIAYDNVPEAPSSPTNPPATDGPLNPV
jgi:hypothetical protein